ncbi:MAG: Eco57I restriction-modification methylase domain-containing protein [Planctomycetaceae bacterium]|jgi:type I restriction-modification system DNA methylase subunit|nr:Eco57I restriction-modification methylase domain-containing protein [Planctomycetaceae bacterium]
MHRCLVNQGFQIRQFDKTGRDTEWIKCTVADVQKAFEKVKEQLYNDEIQRQNVCNEFYEKIRNWFYWTAKTGNDPYSVAEPEYTLRLIVRLLLCFFLRDKGLMPKELFDEEFIKENLKENEEFRYYNAILRNIFFHCLNTPQQDRNEYEHQKLIKNIRNVKDQFAKIPFLNGGLFYEQSGDDFPLDNEHFFSELIKRPILELGGDYKVEGIIRILSRYQYKLSTDDLLDKEYTQTVDPEFIDKVFECLLACIDADTKENKRKTTGSFYTPKEIVDYMVSESLDAYLKNDSGNDLLQCKILDPACGSGAFSCGVINEIMRRLDPNKTMTQTERYRQKLKILQNVIYGVDIQPMAVQISVLRIFLSLIQEIVPDKKKENYGIEPLPNLETKFICANTLIGLAKENQGVLVSPSVKIAIEALKNNRDQYVTANTTQDKQKIQEYDEKLRESFSQLLETEAVFSHDTTERLLKWNPYDQTVSADFFDPQWMFGVESFDVVIGNPPYNVIDTKERLKETYEKIYSHLKSGRINIYQLFFGRSTTLLSPKGILFFIHPKTLLTDAYLAATRKYLLKEFSSFTIVNFTKERGTFSNVTQSVVITQWNKGKDSICCILEVDTKNDLVQKKYFSITKKDIVADDGTLLIAGKKEIYEIEKKCRAVKRLSIKFVTGSMEWNKIREHLSGKKKSGSKRLIYGENIQRFSFEQSSKRSETTYIDRNANANIPTLQQPAILTQRTVNVLLPHRIIATLIEPDTFDTSLTTENSVNVYICNDGNKAVFCLGILNSRLMDFYFRLHNSNNHVSCSELNALPIIDVSGESQKQLTKLVKCRLKGEDVDDKIDALVYEFYGLTDKEIKIIKGE